MDHSLFEETTTQTAPITPPKVADIQRSQIYIPDGESALFGWLHYLRQQPQKNCAVVICNPMGYEYTHSHRAIRHLADQLSTAGFPTLRFDYHGTGDSPGNDLDADRLRCWQQNIHAAIEFALQTTGCDRICLLGIRMGATLAALVASKRIVDSLILWSPCTNGRRYIREMQAIASTAAHHDAQHSEIIESAGFLMSQETATAIKSINLLQQNYQVKRRALIIARDDFAEDTSLFEHLSTSIAVDQIALPGYADMMAEPQFTIVPTTAIIAIVDWLTRQASDLAATRNIDMPATTTALSFAQTDENGKKIPLSEQPCRFGSDDHLFGIVSFAAAHAANKPAVLLLNSGTVHRVGPNRLYVTLARKLAAQGHTCMRIDLEGLGDSVLYKSGRENHPYPDSAVSDTERALRYLRDTIGCSHFILLGLCSGAHTAFHAGIELSEYDIAEVIAINPLTYRWAEGMSLETTQHFLEVAWYKSSARNPKSWLKLLRGKVNLWYLLGLTSSQLRILISSKLQSLRERFFPKTASPLAKDLSKLLSHGRSLNLFIASNDPGYELLMTGAKYITTKAIKAGRIRVQFIADSNHTFSIARPRAEVIARICQHIASR